MICEIRAVVTDETRARMDNQLLLLAGTRDSELFQSQRSGRETCQGGELTIAFSGANQSLIPLVISPTLKQRSSHRLGISVKGALV
jgi:hypothetical protein